MDILPDIAPFQRRLDELDAQMAAPAFYANPRKATVKDVESADVVISIGCDLSGLPQPRGGLVRWDEVPPLSEDFARADEAIRKRVIELIEELVRSTPKQH